MMKEAFELSERYHTVVVIIYTRSFSQATGAVEVTPGPHPQPALPMNREPLRWVTYPRNAVEAHRALHEKLNKLQAWSNESSFNQHHASARRGIIGVGFAYTKLLDVVGEAPEGLSLLKLGTLYPAPDAVIARFLQACDEVLVVEENEPYLETEIKVIAHEQGVPTRVLGKCTDHVPRAGELFRWQVQEALERWIEDFVPARSFTREAEAEERPHREDCCIGCPYPEIIAALRDVGRQLDQEPVLVGDPGCLVKAAELLDAKYALGSAAAVAQGVARGLARGGTRERAVAIFGDSAFFHTGVPALINAVYQQASALMIVLDNSATVTSGFQPNPGSGKGARGQDAPRLSIEGIAAACGVDLIMTVGPDDDDETLRRAFRDGLTTEGLALIVVRKPCRRDDV